jgi:Anaerobic ribonucleoside-triphosphate reductase
MEKEKCTVEVFSRVTGFFRPVQSWNAGKTEEFSARKTYALDFNKCSTDSAEKVCTC